MAGTVSLAAVEAMRTEVVRVEAVRAAAQSLATTGAPPSPSASPSASSTRRAREPSLTQLRPRALFTGISCTVSQNYHSYLQADHHPDPLRLWRDLGTSCPQGWYALSVRRTAADRCRPLYLRVEMEPAAPPASGFGSGQSHAPVQLRTVWFTPSVEHAAEVARQLREGERCALHPGSSRGRWALPPTLWAVRRSSGDYVHGMSVTDPHVRFDQARAWVRVYRRDGDVPRLVHEDIAAFMCPVWRDGP
jgi:hypothetical protein